MHVWPIYSLSFSISFSIENIQCEIVDGGGGGIIHSLSLSHAESVSGDTRILFFALLRTAAAAASDSSS